MKSYASDASPDKYRGRARPPIERVRGHFLDREALLNLDIDRELADRLLAASALTGHGGRRVVEGERLEDLLGLIVGEGVCP
jgi:hypothetical protein